MHHNDIADTSCILMHNLICLKVVRCYHKLMATSMLLFCLKLFSPSVLYSFKMNVWVSFFHSNPSASDCRKDTKKWTLSCQTRREIFAMFDSESESLSVKCIAWYLCYTFQICFFSPYSNAVICFLNKLHTCIYI